MAVAIPIAIMGHDGEKKVHPFFSKPQSEPVAYYRMVQSIGLY
jgi:hypothetical protein